MSVCVFILVYRNGGRGLSRLGGCSLEHPLIGFSRLLPGSERERFSAERGKPSVALAGDGWGGEWAACGGVAWLVVCSVARRQEEV